jgi:hypothetical protein
MKIAVLMMFIPFFISSFQVKGDSLKIQIDSAYFSDERKVSKDYKLLTILFSIYNFSDSIININKPSHIRLGFDCSIETTTTNSGDNIIITLMKDSVKMKECGMGCIETSNSLPTPQIMPIGKGKKYQSKIEAFFVEDFFIRTKSKIINVVEIKPGRYKLFFTYTTKGLHVNNKESYWQGSIVST